MSCNQTLKLSSGYDCPIMGYGTFMATDAAQLKTALTHAVKTGYRHIDTAFRYNNEAMVGGILHELYKKNVVKREDMFITTKLFSTQFRTDLVLPMLKKQLALLHTDYVDLYLLHNPFAMKPPATGNLDFCPPEKFEIDCETKLEDVWAALEKCVKEGLARSIGFSNFNISQVEQILKSGTIKPVMNQIEVQPFFQNQKLVEFCHSHGIHVTAYSSFGRSGAVSSLTGKKMCDIEVLKDEQLVKIGAKYGKTPAQVIIRWLIQLNIIPIPGTVVPSWIEENFNIWDFSLSTDDMAQIVLLDKNKRFSWLPYKDVTDHPEYPFISDGSSC